MVWGPVGAGRCVILIHIGGEKARHQVSEESLESGDACRPHGHIGFDYGDHKPDAVVAVLVVRLPAIVIYGEASAGDGCGTRAMGLVSHDPYRLVR